jgi:hypothetical protein
MSIATTSSPRDCVEAVAARAGADVEHAPLDEPEPGALRLRPVLRLREEPLAPERRPVLAVVALEKELPRVPVQPVEQVAAERVVLVSERSGPAHAPA